MKNTKSVDNQEKWSIVASELEAENLKLASYDKTLIPLLENISEKKILDYGCGPGILALTLQKLAANIKVYDISSEMLQKAEQKIGKENVYYNYNDIPSETFDHVICNLVLCIVPEDEVKNIAINIKKILKKNGTAFVGFCNPKIFHVPESQLDFRFSTAKYEENHTYKKIKKEGGYEILELHRPLEWYKKTFSNLGLKVVDEIFTPSYTLNDNCIQDFVIFKLEVQ